VADGSQEQALEPSFADGPPTRFDAEGFREVMARFASGVTVVTAVSLMVTAAPAEVPA